MASHQPRRSPDLCGVRSCTGYGSVRCGSARGPEAARTRQEPLKPPARLSGLPTSYQPARTLPAAPRRALERVEAPEGPTDAQEGARSLPGRSRSSHGRQNGPRGRYDAQEGARKPAGAGLSARRPGQRP
jgi:hypothetical protein